MNRVPGQALRPSQSPVGDDAGDFCTQRKIQGTLSAKL